MQAPFATFYPMNISSICGPGSNCPGLYNSPGPTAVFCILLLKVSRLFTLIGSFFAHF
jgi:hypothetical protein